MTRVVPYIGWCPKHEKKIYAERKLARRAIRQMHEKGMSAYPCDEVAGGWHVGHMPPEVLRGDKPRSILRRTR